MDAHARPGAIPLVLLLTATLLTSCSAGAADDPAPGPSTSGSSSPSPTPTEPAAPTATPEPAPTAPADPAPAPEEPAPTGGPSTGGATTELLLTFTGWNPAAGAVEVSGYVPVVEAGGRCVLTLTRAGSTVTRETTAEPDAGTTSCGWISVPGSELSPGAWDARVTYTSSASSAAAGPVTIEVP